MAETQRRIRHRHHSAARQFQDLQCGLLGQRFQRSAAQVDDAPHRCRTEVRHGRRPVAQGLLAQLRQGVQAGQIRVLAQHRQGRQQHAAETAGHGEAAVAAAFRHQQVIGIAVVRALARQLAIGVAGDVQEARAGHDLAQQFHGGQAFRAVAAAGKRDEQGGRVRFQVQLMVRQQRRGGDGADLRGPGRIQGIGDDFAHVGRAAGARQDDALLRMGQGVAQEGGQCCLLLAQDDGQRPPDGWLLRDLLGRVQAADVAPGLNVTLKKGSHERSVKCLL